MKADVDVNPHSKSARGKPLLRKCTLNPLKENKDFFFLRSIMQQSPFPFAPFLYLMFLAFSNFYVLSLLKARPTITENFTGGGKKKGYIYASQGVFLNTKQKGRREKNYTPSGAKRRLRNEKAFCSWIEKKALEHLRELMR